MIIFFLYIHSLILSFTHSIDFCFYKNNANIFYSNGNTVKDITELDEIHEMVF